MRMGEIYDNEFERDRDRIDPGLNNESIDQGSRGESVIMSKEMDCDACLRCMLFFDKII